MASFNRVKAMNLANKLSVPGITVSQIIVALENASKSARKTWGKACRKLAKFLVRLRSGNLTGKTAFSVFAKGNSKLPFWAFSALPLITCPGAGDCASFCYSLKSWRYPNAFMRQFQNTVLIKFFPGVILESFRKLPQDSILRLYVDGDFDSKKTVEYWFNLLSSRSDIKAYWYRDWETDRKSVV